MSPSQQVFACHEVRVRGGAGGGLQKRLCERKHRWGGPDVAHAGLSCLPGYTAVISWTKQEVSSSSEQGGNGSEASLLPDNSSISSEQSWAKFGDGSKSSPQGEVSTALVLSRGRAGFRLVPCNHKDDKIRGVHMDFSVSFPITSNPNN